MDMQVIERRDQDLVAKIHHLPTPVHVLRQFGIDAIDQTIRFDHDIAVRNDLKLTRCRGMDDVSSEYFHAFYS